MQSRLSEQDWADGGSTTPKGHRLLQATFLYLYLTLTGPAHERPSSQTTSHGTHHTKQAFGGHVSSLCLFFFWLREAVWGRLFFNTRG